MLQFSGSIKKTIEYKIWHAPAGPFQSTKNLWFMWHIENNQKSNQNQ